MGRAWQGEPEPGLFLPNTSPAVDIGVVQPASMSSYYHSKIEAYGEHHPREDEGAPQGPRDQHLKSMAYAILVMEYQHQGDSGLHGDQLLSRGQAAVADGKA